MTRPFPGGPRWGVTLPWAGLAPREQRPLVAGLRSVGYDDVWTGEGSGTDAFTPLAAAAAWAPELRVASGVVPAFTRGPALLTQTAATLAGLADGGLVLGIGSSVPAHVSDINGIPFTDPFRRTRDVLRFLVPALRGERVGGAFDTFTIREFQLSAPPKNRPLVVLGALRPRMLTLGFTEGDGAITNILFADDVPKVLAAVGPQPPGKELVVKVFVSPVADPQRARRLARPFLAWITNQKPYRAFHQWLGNGSRFDASHGRWLAGDRRGAEEALADEVVDGLFVHGTPEECRAKISQYVQPGVTTVVLHVQPDPQGDVGTPADALDLLARLRP